MSSNINLYIICLYGANKKSFLYKKFCNRAFTFYNILKLRVYLFGHLDCRHMRFDWFEKSKNLRFTMTWIFIRKILGKSKICFMTSITQITLFSFVVSDEFWLCLLKDFVNWTGTEPQVKPDKYETYNYTHSNLPTARVNDCSKVKAHKLFRLLKLFCLGSDLPLNKKNPKRLTFKYSHLNFCC